MSAVESVSDADGTAVHTDPWHISCHSHQWSHMETSYASLAVMGRCVWNSIFEVLFKKLS